MGNLTDSGMARGVSTARNICAKMIQLKVRQSPRARTSQGWSTPQTVRARPRPRFPIRVLLSSWTYSIPGEDMGSHEATQGVGNREEGVEGETHHESGRVYGEEHGDRQYRGPT